MDGVDRYRQVEGSTIQVLLRRLAIPDTRLAGKCPICGVEINLCKLLFDFAAFVDDKSVSIDPVSNFLLAVFLPSHQANGERQDNDGNRQV